jgi:hypothetical protein
VPDELLTQDHIVKVQLPLATNEELPQMLIYTEDKKTIYLTTPVQERFAKELRKFPHKGYYRATLRGIAVEIGQRVKNQPW